MSIRSSLFFHAADLSRFSFGLIFACAKITAHTANSILIKTAPLPLRWAAVLSPATGTKIPRDPYGSRGIFVSWSIDVLEPESFAVRQNSAFLANRHTATASNLILPKKTVLSPRHSATPKSVKYSMTDLNSRSFGCRRNQEYLRGTVLFATLIVHNPSTAYGGPPPLAARRPPFCRLRRHFPPLSGEIGLYKGGSILSRVGRCRRGVDIRLRRSRSRFCGIGLIL